MHFLARLHSHVCFLRDVAPHAVVATAFFEMLFETFVNNSGVEFDDPARGKHDGAVEKPDVSSRTPAAVHVLVAAAPRLLDYAGEYCVLLVVQRELP